VRGIQFQVPTDLPNVGDGKPNRLVAPAFANERGAAAHGAAGVGAAVSSVPQILDVDLSGIAWQHDCAKSGTQIKRGDCVQASNTNSPQLLLAFRFLEHYFGLAEIAEFCCAIGQTGVCYLDKRRASYVHSRTKTRWDAPSRRTPL
jgi:hypothetical protein